MRFPASRVYLRLASARVCAAACALFSLRGGVVGAARFRRRVRRALGVGEALIEGERRSNNSARTHKKAATRMQSSRMCVLFLGGEYEEAHEADEDVLDHGIVVHDDGYHPNLPQKRARAR